MHPVKQISHRVEWVPHVWLKKREISSFLHRVVWDLGRMTCICHLVSVASSSFPQLKFTSRLRLLDNERNSYAYLRIYFNKSKI